MPKESYINVSDWLKREREQQERRRAESDQREAEIVSICHAQVSDSFRLMGLDPESIDIMLVGPRRAAMSGEEVAAGVEPEIELVEFSIAPRGWGDVRGHRNLYNRVEVKRILGNWQVDVLALRKIKERLLRLDQWYEMPNIPVPDSVPLVQSGSSQCECSLCRAIRRMQAGECES